jgi:hypothetical protein
MGLERNAGTASLLLVFVGPVTESSEFQLYLPYPVVTSFCHHIGNFSLSKPERAHEMVSELSWHLIVPKHASLQRIFRYWSSFSYQSL